jgi:hypothetical protein
LGLSCEEDRGILWRLSSAPESPILSNRKFPGVLRLLPLRPLKIPFKCEIPVYFRCMEINSGAEEYLAETVAG